MFDIVLDAVRVPTIEATQRDNRMFRKPKRKAKDALRKKDEDDRSSPTNDEDVETNELVAQARQRLDRRSGGDGGSADQASVMHAYNVNQQAATSGLRDLVTSTAEHHPSNSNNSNESTSATEAAAEVRDDGIFRGDKVRNKFHAGPIRAAAHVRVTARFDYQPDVCKDYKETGFCGFGDTCIYLHDRGDTVSGWQLEQQWEQEQKRKKEQQEQVMNDFATGKSSTVLSDGTMTDDDIPFACHVCRGPFRDPVATRCLHYFCEGCIMNHVRTVSEYCPVCNKDTGSVFNVPSKLLAKKRKILGAQRAKETDSWQQYLASFQGESKSDS